MNVFIKKKHFLWQKIIIGATVLVVGVGLLNLFGNQIKNYFYEAAAPLSKMVWSVGDITHIFLASFLQTKSLREENSNLQKENQQLLAQVSSLQETVKEHQALQEVTLNTKGDNFTLLVAGTIRLDAVNDNILINKGSDDGITENMPVISTQKVVYGKISKVYKNFSEVTLISNSHSVVDVKIQQGDPLQNPIYGAVKGQGNLSIYLDLVSPDAKINQGDTLITSGLEGIFPKDLLVGKVINTNKNDLVPFQTASIQPFLNINAIDNVFVVTNYKKEK